MQFSRTMRGFRACILGLFVVAQVACVIPLIYDHTLNIYETAPVAAHKHPLANATVANPDADHHHGLYRVLKSMTLGRFPNGGESDSTRRTEEVRHVGSDTITPGF